MKSIVCLGLTACSLVLAGCDPAPEAVSPPPAETTAPSPSVNLKGNSSSPASTAKATPAPPPVAPGLPGSSMEPEPQGFDPKEIARITQVLDWYAENFVSKHDRVPTIEELKAWKDPNYPFPFKAWPNPPPGKKWVINPKSGQFRLE